MLDHLFRHHYGKMVSTLTRIFGFNHLETVEDAVQDTFVLAMQKWRTQMPENPEAWLTQAAKNRAIDLFRKIKADNARISKFDNGSSVMVLNDLFLDHEIEDSQLRMIFTACHPALNPQDQIAFALKTIAGFSIKEISAALLLKETAVKKRLTRARQMIKENDIAFSLPDKNEAKYRLKRVHEVIYLIFNEGFHSNKKGMPIRKDLCGEALRLSKMILKKEHFRTGNGYALLGLMCFHAARLESKVSENNAVIGIKNQDRSKWYSPLIEIGNNAMNTSMKYDEISTYHLEAAIAVEHLRAKTFEDTNWTKILQLYQQLHSIHQTPITALNICIVLFQLERYDEAFEMLNTIKPKDLEQRGYLYFGTKSEYFKNIGQIDKAIEAIDKALSMVSNISEKQYLQEKKDELLAIAKGSK